jgi:hypothetical protein
MRIRKPALHITAVMALIIAISACNNKSTEKETTSAKVDSLALSDSTLIENEIIDFTPGTEPFKLVSNKGLSFSYKLGEPNEHPIGVLVEIEYTITNQTDNDIYYLNQSCNKLDYYLDIVPVTNEVSPIFACNASWAVIDNLPANDSISFKTHIFCPNNADPIKKVGIDLRGVNRFIEAEILKDNPEMIDKIYRAPVDTNNIIWAKEK